MFDWLHRKCQEQYSWLVAKNKKLYNENRELWKKVDILEERANTGKAIAKELEIPETELMLRKKLHRQRREIRRLYQELKDLRAKSYGIQTRW